MTSWRGVGQAALRRKMCEGKSDDSTAFADVDDLNSGFQRDTLLGKEDNTMRQNELQEAARRQPFRPFRLVISTGATYDVRHPDLIMVGRHSAIIGTTTDPAGTAYEGTIIVDLLHVVGIELLTASAPSMNGPAAN
jgi:hypothetical protein